MFIYLYKHNQNILEIEIKVTELQKLYFGEYC